MNSIEIMAETLGLFRELQEVASTQKRLALEGRLEDFLEHCARRESLQQRISTNQRKYRRLQKGGGAGRSTDRFRALRLDMAKVIESVQAIDRETEAFVSERRDEMLKGLKGLRRGLKALKGYAGRPARRSPRFVDRQG